MRVLAKEARTEGDFVVVSYTDGTTCKIPRAWFTVRTGVIPDFGDVEVIDHGQTIRLGMYEADALFAYDEHLC